MRIRTHFKRAVLMLALLGLVTLIAVVVFAVALADIAPAAWRPPVSGAVTRSFDLGSDPFEAGRHRGVDLASPPGTAVRAPCGGAVAFAGRVAASGLVVTLRCGRWRVTHLPLASIAVRPGETLREGALLGTVAASREHAGLHLGVRRAGTRFGYADPLRFLATGRTTPPPLGPAPRPARPRRHTTPRPPASRPAAPPRPVVAPRAVVAPRRVAAPPHADSNPGRGSPVAPWPVWLGLALVLAGAGLRLRGGPWTGRGRVPAAGTLTR
jgi:hypothetical protein